MPEVVLPARPARPAPPPQSRKRQGTVSARDKGKRVRRNPVSHPVVISDDEDGPESEEAMEASRTDDEFEGGLTSALQDSFDGDD